MQFLLGVHESFGHRIAQEGVALVIEGGDFAAIQREALMMAFVEGLAFLAQALVLLPRIVIGHERFDTPADALKLGLLDNSLAQLHSLPAHGALERIEKLRSLCTERKLSDIVLELKDLVIDYNPSAHLLRQMMSLPSEQLAKDRAVIVGS